MGDLRPIYHSVLFPGVLFWELGKNYEVRAVYSRKMKFIDGSNNNGS